jgi:hypothetical protein
MGRMGGSSLILAVEDNSWPFDRYLFFCVSVAFSFNALYFFRRISYLRLLDGNNIEIIKRRHDWGSLFRIKEGC